MIVIVKVFFRAVLLAPSVLGYLHFSPIRDPLHSGQARASPAVIRLLASVSDQ